MDPQGLIALQDVSRSFGSTRALRGVSLELRPGEVLGLVGANGAGKSTLNKVLSGVVTPDTGSVLVDGAPVRLRSPLHARAVGIETVHQHASEWTVPGMSTAENLVLDRLAAGDDGPWASPRRVAERAGEVAATLGLHLSRATLRGDVDRLGVSDRQLVALARSLARDPRALILDEPTSALSAREVERLLGLVAGLRDRGVAVLYVSHRLEEVAGLADRVVVLREGAVAAELARPFASGQVVRAMLGEAARAGAAATRRGTPAPGAVVARLRDAQVLPGTARIDLDLRAGEVLGLTGAVGAGKSELLGALFGTHPLHGGTLELEGAPFAPRHPADAVAAGVHLVPEDRATQAIIPAWSVRANTTLASLRRSVRRGLLARGDERRRTRGLIERLRIVCAGTEAPVESLSGGNQQKVVVGRWLLEPARVLLLDEPFRGVDLGARRDLGEVVRELAADRAVVVASSDVDEVLELADRIVVLDAGAVVADVAAADADREQLTLAASGVAA